MRMRNWPILFTLMILFVHPQSMAFAENRASTEDKPIHELDESSKEGEPSNDTKANDSSSQNPVLRRLLGVNEKLNDWILKPIEQGYKKVAPQAVISRIRRVISNAMNPDVEPTEDPLFDPFDDENESNGMGAIIADPLERVNRLTFKFNDKAYFAVIKPIALGYNKVVPQGVRVSINRAFSNATSPIRFINCIFQRKFKGAGIELSRFITNTIFGIAGFFDPAKTELGLENQDEDLGQTLGSYGIGPGVFLNIPLLGPSSVRSTLGLIGDGFFRPWPYTLSTIPNIGIMAYHQVNTASLNIGVYEDFKSSALDPYISMRNAYIQLRQAKVRD